MRITIAALGAVLAFTACAKTASPPPAPDLAVEERAVRAADSAWLAAATARDAAGEAAPYADNGMAFRASAEPVAGPAAIREFVTKYYAANPKAVNSWQTRGIEVAPSGDFAVQTGTYTETNAGPKGDKQNRGNFVTVWKKVNGQWKVATDIGQPLIP